jgi:uncharacterized membrane protein
VPTTAWRFPGTEGADNAVARLKQLDSQDLINLMDIAVLRWPEYAAEPTTQEHVHEQGGKVASMVRRLQRPVIDGSMIETVKGDMRPGTSAVVLLSAGAEIDAVVHAFEGQPMELIRSDLSVPEQDRLRLAVQQARQREPGQGSLPTPRPFSHLWENGRELRRVRVMPRATPGWRCLRSPRSAAGCRSPRSRCRRGTYPIAGCTVHRWIAG